MMLQWFRATGAPFVPPNGPPKGHLNGPLEDTSMGPLLEAQTMTFSIEKILHGEEIAAIKYGQQRLVRVCELYTQPSWE